jgi:hypothetical protein
MFLKEILEQSKVIQMNDVKEKERIGNNESF